jgi:N-methylhydantoinase A
MAQAGTSRFRIGVDTGGTFTDIVAVDTGSGAMRVTKVASTPLNPAVGLVRGVAAILQKAGATAADVSSLAHGTTVATNALLQGEIASLGLIVTAGFRHILEIARQSVPEGYGNSYFWLKPERIVPLRFVCEAGGRLNYKGEELHPLDEASVRAAARFFRDRGIRAIAISLIHSYANPTHEHRTAEIVAEEYPGATLSLSSVVLPEYREYERTVTTLVDAFVKPHMERYLRRVHQELGPELKDVPFLVMQSSGGVASAGEVVRKPITTALSGPAAGALGSAVIAGIAGFPDIVTLDAGGTSTDLCLIEGGKPQVTNAGSVGPFPIRIPMIDPDGVVGRLRRRHHAPCDSVCAQHQDRAGQCGAPRHGHRAERGASARGHRPGPSRSRLPTKSLRRSYAVLYSLGARVFAWRRQYNNG